MKNFTFKLLSVFLIVGFNSLVVSSANNNTLHLVKEVQVFDNDTTFKLNYLYDDQLNKVLEIKSFYEAAVWKNLNQTEWFYIGSDCYKQIERIWKYSTWTDAYKIEKTTQGEQVIELHTNYADGTAKEEKKIVCSYSGLVLTQEQDFHKENDAWSSAYKIDYFYENGQLTSTEMSVNVSLDSIAKYKNTFTYNSDSTMSSQVEQTSQNGIDYVNSKMTNWYYKQGTKLVSSQRTKTWDADFSNWRKSEMIVNEYDALGQLEREVFYEWATMFWQSNTSYTYQYDASGNISQRVLLLPIYNQWRNVTSINYIDLVEEDGLQIESISGFWGSGTSGDLVSSFIPYVFNNELVVQRAKQINVTYTIYDSITDPENHVLDSDNKINIYPNPSTGVFYFNTQNYKVDSWSVYQSNGSLVKHVDLTSESGVIDLSAMPDGMYILMVNTPDSLLTQKLIKE